MIAPIKLCGTGVSVCFSVIQIGHIIVRLVLLILLTPQFRPWPRLTIITPKEIRSSDVRIACLGIWPKPIQMLPQS